MARFGKIILQKNFLNQWQDDLKQHPLKWIEIEITRRCPLSCLHCGSSCSMNSSYHNELSMEEILKVFRRFAEAFDPSQIKVAITGGEPLARKDIFHIIANITEMGYKASVVTNGLVLSSFVCLEF